MANIPDSLHHEELLLMRMFGKDKKYFENDSVSSEIYQNFIASITTNNHKEFPNYYGGAFVDDQGELNINIIDQDTFVIHDLQTRLRDDRFKVIKAKYTLSQLIELQTLVMTLDNGTTSLSNLGRRIKSSSINEHSNRVDVYIDDIDDSIVAQIKSLIPENESLAFFQYSGKSESQANIVCGQRLYANKYHEYPGSFAFRAKRNGVEGFITAQHCCPSGLSVYDYSGNTIGTSIAQSLTQTCDASFVQPTSNYIPTNSMLDGGTLGLTIHTPVVGQLLVLMGASTQYTAGYLITLAHSYSDNWGNWVLPAVQYAPLSQSGDSGGIVYRLIGGIRFACGIHHGITGVVSPYGQLGAYTGATLACSNLGAARY